MSGSYIGTQTVKAPLIHTGYALTIYLDFDQSQFTGETYTAYFRKKSGGADIFTVVCTTVSDKSLSMLLSAGNTLALAAGLDFNTDTINPSLEVAQVFCFLKRDGSDSLLMDGHIILPVVKVNTA